MLIQFWENSSSSRLSSYANYWLTLEMLVINSSVSRFNKQAAALNVSAIDLYNALLADAEIQSSNWNLQGRQADLWKQFGGYFIWQYFFLSPSFFFFGAYSFAGYTPQDMFDAGGANTKQVSRTLEVCTDDLAFNKQWTCWNRSIFSTILPFLKLLKLSETQRIHRRCTLYSSVVESSFWLNSTPHVS